MDSYLDQMISNHRSAMRYHVIFGIGVFLLGIAIITLGFLLQEKLKESGLSAIFSIGGAFVSSLSGFQLKEILGHKEKANVLKTVKLRVLFLDKGKNKNDKERAKIDELIWKLIEKTVTG